MSEKQSLKRKKGRTPRQGRPIAVLYHLYILISVAIMRLKGVKIVNKSEVKGIKGPAIVLAPHISMKDHIIVGWALFPKRPTFVLSEHFMSKPFLGRALRMFGKVISKKMFCPDAGTIRGIMRAKAENNIIVLFPEGRLNAAFHSLPVTPGTAELVKKLGIDVYTVAGHGSGLTFPKWGEKFRKGNITITGEKVMSAEEIGEMSVEHIASVIDAIILHDDEKASEGIRYKCKDTAKGLDGILYKCPECGSEFTLSAGNNRISCSACGFETELLDTYRFASGKMASVNEWFYWQRESLDMDRVLEDDIKIGAVGENGIMDFDAGNGHVRMTKDDFYLKGSVFGEDIEFTKKTSSIGGTPYTPMREFDIYYDKKLLYLMPEDRRRIMLYVEMVDKACS